jgi:hypothetical protein
MVKFNLRFRLLEAYRRLLRPLVRLLLRNGISFNEFADTARDIFIEESIKHAWIQETDASVARVAIMTGLPRPIVDRILTSWAEDSGDSDRTRLARITRLLTGWSTDPRYVGPYGWPVDVPFAPLDSEDGLSFSDLSKRYSGAATPATLLEELISVGAVRRLESGHLRLESRSYIPDALTDVSLNRLSTVVSNVIETLDHNIRVEREEDARFERTVAADHGLTARQIPRFSIFLEERGVKFLEELDAWMASNPPGADDERLGVGVGVYLYVENEADRLKPAELGLRKPQTLHQHSN